MPATRKTRRRVTSSTCVPHGINLESGKAGGWSIFLTACSNYRVWMLAAIYGASFGVELFIHNIAASYYVDRFGLSLESAGFAAGIFGLLALFARALGGIFSDRIAVTRGLDGRTYLLFGLMLAEGIGLLLFSQAGSVGIAIAAMAGFGLFTHMACGATYALMPFVDRKALGGVAGVIGAGGNVGAVLCGFLNKAAGTPQQALYELGLCVIVIAFCAVTIRFSMAHKTAEQRLLDDAVASRNMLEPQHGLGATAD